jgi:ketopantoate reductase
MAESALSHPPSQGVATADPSCVGPVDLVLFCVKSFDTEPAARALKPLMAIDTTVLTLQNGIDNASGIAEIVGTAAGLLGLHLQPLEVQHASDLERAVQSAVAGKADAVKTANTLGLAIPRSLLLRADEVIV